VHERTYGEQRLVQSRHEEAFEAVQIDGSCIWGHPAGLPVEDIPVDVICPACGLNQYVNERGGQGAYWDRSRAKFKGFD
jgi:rubredoxin